MTTDRDERIAALSDHRRRLLQSLMLPAPETPGMLHRDQRQGRSAQPDGHGVAAFYDAITERLNSTPAGRWALFLDYGYLDGTDDQGIIQLPERIVNRPSVKLIVELVGDTDIHAARILDVGCGRGGTVDTLLRYFRPEAVTGLDLSPAAVRFCNESNQHPSARFVIGNSMCLPFADERFDVVTNVESSHCYPDVVAFYREVRRVLKTGGVFLYTDLLRTASLSRRREILGSLDFTLEVDRDITPNVVAACDLVAARRAAAFAGNQGDLRDFLAMPGSEPYEAMQSGSSTYVIWRLRAGS